MQRQCLLNKKESPNWKFPNWKMWTTNLKEELHTIIFMYKTDRSRYGKFIEEMENDVLQGKDPFLKTVSDACRILAGWRNRYGNKETIWLRQMMEWHLWQQATRKRKAIRKRRLHATNVENQGITPTNVMKSKLWRHQRWAILAKRIESSST